MSLKRVLLVLLVVSFTIAAFAQQRGAQQQATPEERAAQAARRAEILKGPRPIDALDTVWIEEMTFFEVRDALKSGKATTALILTGGIEQNGPYLATGKHNYVLRGTGEAIARKLGNALIAPIVTLEPGDPNNVEEPGSVFLSEQTYRAVLTDMGNSLRSQGFKHVVFMGDSGSNQDGMKQVTETLNAAWKGKGAAAHFIPEYYNNADTRNFVKSQGIPEKLNSDNIHDEYFITAEMMVFDPKTVRYNERTKANKATINGVSIVPKEKVIEMGKKIIDFRANASVAAIRKSIGQVRSN
jgi:creatinine amidohydrolase/Fe(II)-dependent formamide hydrolase-like protein